MKKTRILQILVLGAAFLGGMASCEPYNDPLKDEQYKKEVYLVGAAQDIWDREVSFNGDGTSYVSVAVGGSQFSSEDITVTIGNADNAKMDLFNYKNFGAGDVKYQAMPTEWYKFASTTGVIKAGDVYARIPFTIDMTKVHPDSLYVIPLRIVGTSVYTIVTKDTILLFHPKMVNNYSGAYTFDGTTYQLKDGKVQSGSAAPISTLRNATAIDANTIRLFQKVVLEKGSNVAANTYTIRINSDNTLTIKGYNKMNISVGEGKYDPETKIFSFWYDYAEGGKQYRTMATLTPSKTTE